MRKKDKYRYLYPIYNEMSKREFSKTCRKIKNGFNDLEEEEIIEGIGHSQIQIYRYEGQKIGVYNDETIDAVYVCSDVELNEILGVNSIY